MKIVAQALCSACFMLCLISSSAEIVEVTFTGTVSATSGLTGISVGDPASGIWTYDNQAPSVTFPVAPLFDSDGSLVFEINGLAGSLADVDVRLLDAAVGPRDQMDWTTYWWTGVTPVASGPIFALGAFNALTLTLADVSGLSISNGELPETIVAADWDFGTPGSRLRLTYDSPVCCVFVQVGFLTVESQIASSDADGDMIADSVDNCIESANPGQQDTDADGFGNICDPDLNNDGIVNAVDLGLFKLVFFSNDPDADFNSDNIVNAADLGLLKLLFFMPPGPSAFAP